MCVSPGCKVCQWPHYARTVGLGSTPGYPPAGNCVPLSCLVLGLFWLFDFFFLLLLWFFFFFLVSDLQLVQIMLAADDCRKKISKHKRKKKKALPKPKDLKNKQTKKTKPTWRGMERILLSWRPMESTSVYESFSEKSAAGWLGELCSLCFLLLCTFSGSSLLGF